jgi:sec-independent protein translocase protein TatA
MPNIGPVELGIILLIILVIFGPKRLPGLGRQLGSGMREFKESITGRDRNDDDEDDDHDEDDRDAFGQPATQRARPAIEPAPAPAETEVVTGDARREDQPASRTDS